MSAAITATGVSKSFGGVTALSDVSFEVSWETVVGLIGPNGAGKSTLFNAVTNVDPPDAGSISIADCNIAGMPPHRVAGLGVSRTFQTSRTFPHLSVRENILVGGYLADGRPGALGELFASRRGRRFNRKLRGQADALIAAFQLSAWADHAPNRLPPAARKQVDLARALIGMPRLLLLDEPAAGLNDRETEGMAEAIIAIRRMGVTVLVVEHNMALLMGVADRVVVLDAGRVIASGDPAAMKRDARVVTAYFGGQVNDDA